MPYDPRQMQQIGRMGVGMLGNSAMPPWWQQPQQPRRDQPADQNEDPSQAPDRPRQPPSLLDMMMGLGRMTRPEYDKAIQGPGSYGVAPKDAARLGPWGFLGSLGAGGGAR